MSLYRFSSHEVKLEIDCLQELIGMRVGNVHQTEKDTLLFKFWKLGISRNLIIENAIRFHITEFPREKPKTPPAFCVRLRKYLRFRRLDDIIQPGNDRAVYFIFGDLVLGLELFQAGNVILFQQSDSKILAVLRYHVIQGTTVIGVNQPYMVDQFRDYIPPSDEAVHNFFQNPPEKTNQKLRTFCTKIFPFHRNEFVAHSLTVAGIPIETTADKYVYNHDQIDIFIKEMRRFDEILLSKPLPRPPRPRMNPDDPQNHENNDNTNNNENGTKTPKNDAENNSSANTSTTTENNTNNDNNNANNNNGNEVQEVERPLIPKPCGFVYAPKPKERMLCGVQLAHWDSKFVTRYDTFDAACDHFWSVSELETAQQAKKQAESVPDRKVNSVKRNFEKKKNQLQGDLNQLNRTGALVHKYANEIEQCRMIINSFIGNHVRWDEIRASIRAYQESGNELAQMIDKVDFEAGIFWVLLTDNETDENGETIPETDNNNKNKKKNKNNNNNNNNGEVVRVSIDLRKTAYANASEYFDKRSGISEKLQRTTDKENEVVRKVDREAQKTKKTVSATIQERRKTWWFERFHWFITTENYLVLAGRDRTQNDVLFKHYLKKGDIYLHAEIHGAASVIVKNPSTNGRPVSPISIQQAAEFAISRSTAWKTNEPCQCFWVYSHQVKKNLPGQQPAPQGSFYIVGEKHFIVMTMPQMGIGILFHVTEAHVGAHSEERRIRVDDEDNNNHNNNNNNNDNNNENNNNHNKNNNNNNNKPKRMNSEELNEQLPYPVVEQSGDIPQVDETTIVNDNDDENEEEEEEGDDEEEELTDEELARIALEEPERADVAQRRLARKAKRNRPKPKPAPLEEGVAEVMENEGMAVDLDVSGINALTGCPKHDDEFYAAYAMVAPLSALISFKYKIKFVPGDTKKGKAWPVMMNYFTNMKGIPPTEPGLIKLMPPNDVINQLPFNLKLSLGAGGTAMQKNKKAQKSKGKKRGKR